MRILVLSTLAIAVAFAPVAPAAPTAEKYPLLRVEVRDCK